MFHAWKSFATWKSHSRDHVVRIQPCLCMLTSSREEPAFVSVRFTKGQRASFLEENIREKALPLSWFLLLLPLPRGFPFWLSRSLAAFCGLKVAHCLASAIRRGLFRLRP